MVVIGITGTLGAGKGSIVEFLEKEHGFQHFSVRGFLIDEIKKRELPVNRDSMRDVANDLRAKNSPSYIVDQLYQKAKQTGKNCIIESIRTPGEVMSLRKNGNFRLFGVDCDAKIRYKRIKARKSETDDVDFETFLSNENAEMNTTDPNKQNLAKCIEMADVVFDNNGSLQNLHDQVREAVKRF